MRHTRRFLLLSVLIYALLACAACRRSEEATRRSRFRAGLVALVLIAVAVFFAFTKADPFASSYSLPAVVRTANVSASFIKEIRELGYANTSIEQLVRLKDHGVSAAYIKRMKERGYGDLTLDEYIRLRDRGERE